MDKPKGYDPRIKTILRHCHSTLFTYSKARQFYKVSPGPRPIRSRQFPNGFPWLSQSNKQKADKGTKLAERAWDLYFLAHEIGGYLSW